MLRLGLVQLLLVVGAVNGLQWPAWAYKLPWIFGTGQQPLLAGEPDLTPPRNTRVAIIGAGAGGSSAAYWLSLAKTRANLTFDIDVYERADYVGGRSTIVFPYGNHDFPHIELGGSIFVNGNKNMVRAAREFNLTATDSDFGHRGELGIWDGQTFVFRTETSGVGSWWGKLSALWRYGYSAPSKVDSIVKEMLRYFLTLYDSDFGTWRAVRTAVEKVQLLDVVAQTGTEYFDTQGVGLKFSRELVDAATRVNYGQNLENIHGFGGLVSMSADSASTIVSGNRAIFENFIKAADANLLLNQTVTQLKKKSNVLEWLLTTSDGIAMEYDAVIIAAPLPFANIEFKPALSTKIPTVPYVHLHVTLLTTTSKHPKAEYFGLRPGQKVPTTVLTTSDGVRNGKREPEFNSLNYIRPLKEGGEEWVVKIFSNTSLSDAWLEHVFDGKVGWVHRKEWDAYPRLDPVSPDAFPPIELGEGLYYVNAFEAFISTMETETIAARNVVDMLLQDVFKSSICPSPEGEAPVERSPKAKDDFVYGYDCI